ncbi:MAG: hypothetical protein ACLFVK_01425 [Dehalococcoidia bacterium]
MKKALVKSEITANKGDKYMSKTSSMAKLLAIGLLLVGGMGIATGCARYDSTNVSVQEAKAVLDKAVTYASSGKVEKLCNMGGSVSICEHHLRDAGGDESIPSEPPEIVDTYLVREKHSDNRTQLGGRVLVLEGVDGRGATYHTEFLVTRVPDSRELIALYPVYWSGIGVGQTDEEAQGIATPESLESSRAQRD